MRTQARWPAAARRLRRRRRDVLDCGGEVVLGLGATGFDALLGLADEAALAIEIDAAGFQSLRDDSGQVPCAWSRRGWKVFLDSTDDIKRAIRYVEGNPGKQGRAAHAWEFVTRYEERFNDIETDFAIE